jgi:hypothetical protein
LHFKKPCYGYSHHLRCAALNRKAFSCFLTLVVCKGFSQTTSHFSWVLVAHAYNPSYLGG